MAILAVNMRQKLITLDPTSWDLAAKKTNFSMWVRDQLRSERNKTSEIQKNRRYICMFCNDVVIDYRGYCARCRVECGIITGDEEE
jgi:hypothetical protein